MSPLVRRLLLTAGTTAVLFMGGIAVVAAGAWTNDAPVVQTPLSVEQLTAELDAERARSAGLAAQLTELGDRAAELHASLGAAADQAATDTTTASRLRAELDRTRRRLMVLERTVRARHVQRAVSGPGAPAGRGSEGSGQDEDRDGGEHEEGGD